MLGCVAALVIQFIGRSVCKGCGEVFGGVSVRGVVRYWEECP